ncbi:uncharacterized protein PG986_013781 [Apiospora aurea]|uniref:Uncharacterized protein n=1 Tax=Apiospora aurea TaxID=335848 RepID=A0ABR1PWL2_9PEZI
MALVQIDTDAFSSLKDKVVVITGATTGIGAATVTKLADLGAKVVFGDIKAPEQPPGSDHVTFVHTDVTSYASVLNLFKQAWQLHGRIDYAISNAAVVETGKLFATGDDDGAIEEPPANASLGLFFTRVAVHFLRKSLARHREATGDAAQKDASIVLVGSIASLGEFPGLFQYSATKQGVMGLFRSTKNYLPETEGIRVNAVLPNSTRTKMVAGVIDLYDANGLPSNDPEDVADTFLHALSSRVSGEALYVSGARTYEVEKTLARVKGAWLGQELYDELLACQRALGRLRFFVYHSTPYRDPDRGDYDEVTPRQLLHSKDTLEEIELDFGETYPRSEEPLASDDDDLQEFTACRDFRYSAADDLPPEPWVDTDASDWRTGSMDSRWWDGSWCGDPGREPAVSDPASEGAHGEPSEAYHEPAPGYSDPDSSSDGTYDERPEAEGPPPVPASDWDYDTYPDLEAYLNKY